MEVINKWERDARWDEVAIRRNNENEIYEWKLNICKQKVWRGKFELTLKLLEFFKNSKINLLNLRNSLKIKILTNFKD
jgi:hypothetical protein